MTLNHPFNYATIGLDRCGTSHDTLGSFLSLFSWFFINVHANISVINFVFLFFPIVSEQVLLPYILLASVLSTYTTTTQDTWSLVPSLVLLEAFSD